MTREADDTNPTAPSRPAPAGGRSTALAKAIAAGRWLLVVPAAFAGWYVALIASIFVYGIGQRLCPAELLVSDKCTATWHAPFFDALVIAGAALAAALIVLLPTLMAPARRLLVARLAYGAGLAAALWLVFVDTEGKSLVTPALVGACVAGGVMLWVVQRRLAVVRSRRRDGMTDAR